MTDKNTTQKLQDFEKRLARKPDPEPTPKPEPGIRVKWLTKLPTTATVILMLGTENGMPVLFQKAYRIAGIRKRGKLILKPAVKKNPKG